MSSAGVLGIVVALVVFTLLMGGMMVVWRGETYDEE
jgi:hypothetical protein